MRRTLASGTGADTLLPTSQPLAEVSHARKASSLQEILQHIADNTPEQSVPIRPAKVDGIAIGILRALADDGRALVDIPALAAIGVQASAVVALQATHIGQSVALAFEAGNPERPMVLGILVGSAASAATATATLATAPPAPIEASLDGERVVLTAEHVIELRCGDAALILSADGRIELRGTYITSQASATQRILGGSVNVN
jgi:Domain of unknown function (DUF6484)